MKILISYVFCTKGGVETAIKNRIKLIDYKKYQIDLLFFNDYGGKTIFEGIPCNIFIENNMKIINDLILKNAYDAIISIDTYEIIELLIKIKYQGIKGLEVHTTYEEGMKYLKRITKYDIDFVITPSEYQKNQVSTIIKDDVPIYVLPNSIDMKIFKKRKIYKKHSRPILLWVGRLDNHKNWKKFLELAKEIKYLTANMFDFWIVGGLKSEPNEITSFYKMLYEYDLYDCIRWIPMCDYKIMPNIYSYVSESEGAYITTSNNESFGMTVLEAMACKCTVIVNDVGALGELVDNNTGLILNMEETEKKVADKIIWYLSDFNQISKTQKLAYQFVEDNFKCELIVESFIKILNNINEGTNL